MFILIKQVAESIFATEYIVLGTCGTGEIFEVFDGGTNFIANRI